MTRQTSQRTAVNLEKTRAQTNPTEEATVQTDSPLADVVPRPTMNHSRSCAYHTQRDLGHHAQHGNRRRIAGGRGKFMKAAYFKSIKWTETFVTGPLSPAQQTQVLLPNMQDQRAHLFKKSSGDSKTPPGRDPFTQG